jgi:hypothetical protein
MEAKNTKKNALPINKKSREKYNKANSKSMTFRFMLKSDADILEFLENCENKAGFIKRAIREKMKKDFPKELAICP